MSHITSFPLRKPQQFFGQDCLIEVRVLGIDAVQDRLRQVASDLRPKVLGPAINKVAEKARAEINRAIPQEFAVKAYLIAPAAEPIPESRFCATGTSCSAWCMTASAAHKTLEAAFE